MICPVPHCRAERASVEIIDGRRAYRCIACGHEWERTPTRSQQEEEAALEAQLQAARDRNDGYIPDWPKYLSQPGQPSFMSILGNPWQPDANIREIPVAHGLADELNREPSWWLWAQVDNGLTSEGPEHWSHFTGHRVRVGLDLRTWNERDVHDWKGYDDVRGRGYWQLYFNEQPVYEGYCGASGISYVSPVDVLRCLHRIPQVASQLLELPVDWTAESHAEQFAGRRVIYDGTDAVITRWIPDQGAVVLRPENDAKFPPPPWAEPDYPDDERDTVKDDVLTGRIWWWPRKT